MTFQHKIGFRGLGANHRLSGRLMAFALLTLMAGPVCAGAEPSILEVDTSGVPADLPPSDQNQGQQALPPGIRIPIAKLPNNAYGVAPASPQTPTTPSQATGTPIQNSPATPQRTTPQTGR